MSANVIAELIEDIQIDEKSCGMLTVAASNENGTVDNKIISTYIPPLPPPVNQIVYKQLFSGDKPVFEKTMGILVEDLIDTFLRQSHENKSKHKAKHLNSLELYYIETFLHSNFSPVSLESFKSLQGLLLDKSCKHSSESVENPGVHGRSTKHSEDAITDEIQQGHNISPDDLIALANNIALNCSKVNSRGHVSTYHSSLKLASNKIQFQDL